MAVNSDQMSFVKDFVAVAQAWRQKDANEAETRHKIIDTILHDILHWPKNRVAVEDYIQPGFADYVLKKASGDDLLFIEAKRSGFYFELPNAKKQGETCSYLSVSELLTDDNIKSAMYQVREYCLNTGCEFAGITNGYEWILFKVFEKGKRWDTLKAFVIRGIDFFSKKHTKAINGLAYHSITEQASLIELLTSLPPKDREVFFAKDKIPAYSHPIGANRLAKFLRPIASRLFGVIGDGQTEFMQRCYVAERDYAQAATGMKTHIQDSLTPYFEQFGVQQLQDTGKGGDLGGRITKNLKNERGGEVLVLFGGKGSGKSTFIKRLLLHNPPRWLSDHAVVAIVDLLKVPEDHGAIRGAIWEGLVRQLDSERLLERSRDELLKTLFSDKFEIAKKQDLAGLKASSEAYNTKLNDLVAKWMSDKPYCARALCSYWSEKSRGAIVVVDNTDQFTGSVQDFCFSVAQEICETLGCITLISMREERFHNSKIHGVLDAFQNAGFHISSPKPSMVFIKRIDYAVALLRDPKRRTEITRSTDATLIEEACKYMEIVSRGFKYSASPLNRFLTACGHGDIRLSLDLFRSFLLSGYTNVEEMLQSGKWDFQIHQVIKPVMIPKRYFYDERLSDIPNIFQLRDSRHASHFTALRILRRLSKGSDSGTPQFYEVAELKAEFAEKFRMHVDLQLNLDMLLKHGFVEANNRLDVYDDSVDRVRITSYGQFMLDELFFYFAYLDLVCVDCGTFDNQVSNHLVAAANDEYKLFTTGKRRERVTARLNRVEVFLKYLADEETRENVEFGLALGADDMFTTKASSEFALERKRVEVSAAKQAARRAGRP
jgi:hypothetical protein